MPSQRNELFAQLHDFHNSPTKGLIFHFCYSLSQTVINMAYLLLINTNIHPIPLKIKAFPIKSITVFIKLIQAVAPGQSLPDQ